MLDWKGCNGMLRRIEYWLRKFEYQKRMKAIEEVGG